MGSGRFTKGHVSWNKGKNMPQCFREKISKIRTKNIPLAPTEELGYLCGLVLGDGHLYKQKSKNYKITLETTRKEFRDHFAEAALKVSPLLKSHLYEREKTRPFPNGTTRTDVMFSAIIDSKVIYDALRPFKQLDYCWEIPAFLNTKEAQLGFLRGIFDAEGTVFIHKEIVGLGNVSLSSKHKSTLYQIKNLLATYGITTHFSKASSAWTLVIRNRKNLSLFATRIGFKLNEKQEKLVRILSSYRKGWWVAS